MGSMPLSASSSRSSVGFKTSTPAPLSSTRVVKIPVNAQSTPLSASSSRASIPDASGFKTSTPQRPRSDTSTPNFFKNYDPIQTIEKLDTKFQERKHFQGVQKVESTKSNNFFENDFGTTNFEVPQGLSDNYIAQFDTAFNKGPSSQGRDGNWSSLSGNSISQNCSTVFNQEWFPANNSFANFGEINKIDSITNFDSENAKQSSSSDTRGFDKKNSRPWTPTMSKNYYDENLSSQRSRNFFEEN